MQIGQIHNILIQTIGLLCWLCVGEYTSFFCTYYKVWYCYVFVMLLLPFCMFPITNKGMVEKIWGINLIIKNIFFHV